MFNRKKRAVPSVLLASVLFFSAGVPAYADDASGSEEVSVEATKETPAEAPAEETKKEEPPAPVKVAPAVPVVPVAPDPIVVAPAPPVEPAPALAVPEPVVVPAPAVPAAPVAPPVEAPAAPELPAAPAKDVIIDDPAPVVVAPTVEAETPPGDPAPAEDATPEVIFGVYVTTSAPLNDKGQIAFSLQTKNVPVGTVYGPYVVSLTGAQFQGVNSTSLVVTEEGSTDSTLFWKCATPGATISIAGPEGAVPILNKITGATATVQTLPILGTPGCGTTTPVQEIVPVHVPELTVVQAGENQPGSISVKEPVVGATLSCDPAGAIQGWVTCEWVLDPETPTVKYIFAEGDGKLDPINLGEYSEGVPNPGADRTYSDGYVKVSGDAQLTPTPGGSSDRPNTVTVQVSGHSVVDGSIITVKDTLIDVDGTKPIVTRLDLSGLCGTVQWAWLSVSKTQFGSSETLLFTDGLTLPACDPSKWDDGDDNEHPEQPPAQPWHPGHGHGHHHNGGWNGHAGGPDFNGPTGTPGDLSNNVGVEADSSANTAVVQASSSEVLGMGSTLPDVSYWSNDSDSVEDELAATGVGMSLSATMWTVVLLVAVGVFVYRVTRRRPKHRMAR